jgi:DNA polymerase-3 subunit delta'
MPPTNAKIQLIGHHWAVELLARQEAAGHVPQSLLLAGPPNVGKSTLARFFAQRLNCQSKGARPCGLCRSCRTMASGNHPDIRILDAESESLKIEQIRELQGELLLSPNEGAYRVALLCNFERATLGAANALLKTLEEPGSQVILILTAADPGGLLPTIVSRCQIITLRLLPLAQISDGLQSGWQAPPEQATLLAQLAAGRPGWAIRALAAESLTARREEAWRDLLEMLRQNRVERLAYAAELSRDAERVKETLTLWLTIWRDVLLLQSGCQTSIINLDWRDALQALSRQSSLSQAQEMVTRLRAALVNLERHVNARLNLEVLLLRLPRVMLI